MQEHWSDGQLEPSPGIPTMSADQDSYPAGVDGIEQRLLLGIVVGIVDESDLGGRHAAPDQL